MQNTQNTQTPKDLILGIDIGFGDVKVTLGTKDGSILKQFKYPSTIGITSKNEHVQDKRIYKFKDYDYYVGDNCSHVQSDNLIDIEDYDKLEYYAGLFLYHAMVLCGLSEVPAIVVCGLSKAQIQNSGHFQEALEHFEVQGTKFENNTVYVLPQGAGSKITIDKYGSHFPEPQDEFLGESTFVGCDIGFNTLDMFLVTKGKTSPSLFEGIEQQGVMKIARAVAQKIELDHKRTIGLHEAKEIIDTSVYKLRGKSHDYTEFIAKVKEAYMKDLLNLIEERYGKVLDKCDFIGLSGGGSTIFKSTSDNFIRVPQTAHEYYNSIGFYLFGLTKKDVK